MDLLLHEADTEQHWICLSHGLLLRGHWDGAHEYSYGQQERDRRSLRKCF